MTLEQRVEFLEAIIRGLMKSDRLIIARTMQFEDGRNIQLGKTTGTKIGTEASQKLAFFNTTPRIQYSSTGQTVATTRGLGGSLSEDATWTGTDGPTAYHIGDVIDALKLYGLLAR